MCNKCGIKSASIGGVLETRIIVLLAITVPGQRRDNNYPDLKNLPILFLSLPYGTTSSFQNAINRRWFLIFNSHQWQKGFVDTKAFKIMM